MEEKILNSIDEIDNYLNLIKLAIENTPLSYCKINIASIDEIKYRERSWCYEFYHQLKLAGFDNINYEITINGEIDKSGHPIISNNINPDFIIHKAGTMTNNLIAIEVKVRNNNIKNDFNKFIDMLTKYNYKKCIFISISIKTDELKNTIMSFINKKTFLINNAKNIIIISKPYDNCVEMFSLQDLINNK